MSLDDDFCVAIAHDGTIEGTTQQLDLKTRCYDDALQCERLEELKRDLEFVASLLVPHTSGSARARARCALEAVALEIFRKHAAAAARRGPQVGRRVVGTSQGPDGKPRSGARGVLPLGQGRAGAHVARHVRLPAACDGDVPSGRRADGGPGQAAGLVHRRYCRWFC